MDPGVTLSTDVSGYFSWKVLLVVFYKIAKIKPFSTAGALVFL